MASFSAKGCHRVALWESIREDGQRIRYGLRSDGKILSQIVYPESLGGRSGWSILSSVNPALMAKGMATVVARLTKGTMAKRNASLKSGTVRLDV